MPIPTGSEFDAGALAADKRGRSVSVCIPARDEAATIGPIVERVVADLVRAHGLVDEVVVLDDGSTDATAAVAARAGARVVPVASVLPETGPGRGKGNALWASLYAARGDIICWIDADLEGFDPQFVTGLCGPLVRDAGVALVRGCYRRPYDGRPGEGGRVTELMARPLISQLFPHLSHIVQPIGGEYAGRRSVLERVPFVEGWGVEFALLVDVAALAGVDAIAQVDLGTRVHRNRPLAELAPQAAAILSVALRRAGLGAPDRSTRDLVQFDDAFVASHVGIEVRERPPLVTVPAYRERFGYGETA